MEETVFRSNSLASSAIYHNINEYQMNGAERKLRPLA